MLSVAFGVAIDLDFCWAVAQMAFEIRTLVNSAYHGEISRRKRHPWVDRVHQFWRQLYVNGYLLADPLHISLLLISDFSLETLMCTLSTCLYAEASQSVRSGWQAMRRNRGKRMTKFPRSEDSVLCLYKQTWVRKRRYWRAAMVMGLNYISSFVRKWEVSCARTSCTFRNISSQTQFRHHQNWNWRQFLSNYWFCHREWRSIAPIWEERVGVPRFVGSWHFEYEQWHQADDVFSASPAVEIYAGTTVVSIIRDRTLWYKM